MAGKATKAPRDRFWAFVNVGAANECWEWSGSTRGKGYGAFSTKASPLPSIAARYSVSAATVCRRIAALDERNADLARDRVGMFLEVEDEPSSEGAA